MDFNTSHVSINHLKSIIQIKIIRISIHLMFLLILVSGIAGNAAKEISIHLMFLLILFWSRIFCVFASISIHLMFLLIQETIFHSSSRYDFNTSHVSINRAFVFIGFWAICHFNTSHVSINQFTPPQQLVGNDFNTSHVSINLA